MSVIVLDVDTGLLIWLCFQGMQVQTDDLIEMGRSFCRALLRLSPTEDVLTDDEELVDTPPLMMEDNYHLHGDGETDEEGVSEGASTSSDRSVDAC